MLAAASMGATAFQKGLGAIHSLSHPVGAHYNTHHGETNAVVMPYVLLFNRAAIEERMTRLARYLDLPDPGFPAVLDWVLALRKEIGIPNTLADLGVKESRPRHAGAGSRGRPFNRRQPATSRRGRDARDVRQRHPRAAALGVRTRC